METQESQSKKLGIGKIILIILFLPIAAIWYIWSKTKWSKTAKVLSTVAVIFLMMASLSSEDGKQKTSETVAIKAEESKPEQKQEVVQPQPQIDPEKQKLVDERKNFDTKRGNNAEAASTASGMVSIMNNFGKVKNVDMYVELSSSKDAENDYNNGGDLKTYREKVISSNLYVVLDNTLWTYSPESTKKDLVATFVKSMINLYPNGSPHVKINNGVRDVAIGSWSAWSGEPDIELK